ncbi:MAG: ROK family protein [Acidobacteriota bacterium]
MLTLSFESGGTKLVAALSDESGCLIDRAKTTRRPDQSAAETLDELCVLGEGLAQRSATPPEVIGYGFGGPVSRQSNRPLQSFSERGWDLVDPAEILRKRFGVSAFLENDCNAAALGEALFGAGRGRQTVFYITLGTGCGGGLIHRQRIVDFGDSGEAEFGHIVLDPQGPACPCGSRGCLETYCSGPAISRQALELFGDSYADARAVLQAFLQHDECAARLVDQVAQRLGHGLGIALSLFNPDIVVIGGGVASAGEPLLELIRRHTLGHTFGPFRQRAPIVGSSLGEDAVCLGAAAHARLQSRVAGRDSRETGD